MPKVLPSYLHTARIMENAPVAAGLWRLVFESPYLAKTLAPGQFFTIAVDSEPRQVTRIPLSFAYADVDSGTIETLYSLVGSGTEALSRMREGACTSVLGPCGKGWVIDARTKRCLLVAGGCGVPSVLSAATSLDLQGLSYDAVLAARTAGSLWGEPLLKDLGCSHIFLATDDGSAGEKGTAIDVCERLFAQETYDLVLTCGPPAMLEALAKLCARRHIACQVSLERRMTCGFGACATCVVETTAGLKSACVDGPVFSAEEVVW